MGLASCSFEEEDGSSGLPMLRPYNSAFSLVTLGVRDLARLRVRVGGHSPRHGAAAAPRLPSSRPRAAEVGRATAGPLRVVQGPGGAEAGAQEVGFPVAICEKETHGG